MIKAILQGKSRGYEYLEDLLTSTVFGTLNYLPPDKVIIPFIESAILHDKQKKLWEVLRDKGIDLRSYQSIKMHFWAKHIKYGEPDLILLFTNHVHNDEDLLIIIEAKFKSDKSGTGENDQLMRYYKAIYDDIENFNEQEIAEFKGVKGYIIYLTESEAIDEIEASVLEIKKTNEDYSSSIFHLRWNQLHKLLSNSVNRLSLQEKVIVEDMINYLEKLGLCEFSGISSPDNNIIRTINNKGNSFYSNNTYFKLLPKVNLESKKYCFYRGEE